MQHTNQTTDPTAQMVEAITRQLGYDRPPVSLTEQETAEVIRATPATLATWRSTGRYKLPYVRNGRKVAYLTQGVAAFLVEQTKEVA